MNALKVNKLNIRLNKCQLDEFQLQFSGIVTSKFIKNGFGKYYDMVRNFKEFINKFVLFLVCSNKMEMSTYLGV